MKILTNNPAVIEKYQNFQLETFQTAVEVLKKARDLIHLGHKLFNHPLAGSVKPNETPYRSLLLSAEDGNLDYLSLSYIETALCKYEQFFNDHPLPIWSQKVLIDFQLIDLTLVTNGYRALYSVNKGGY